MVARDLGYIVGGGEHSADVRATARVIVSVITHNLVVVIVIVDAEGIVGVGGVSVVAMASDCGVLLDGGDWVVLLLFLLQVSLLCMM